MPDSNRLSALHDHLHVGTFGADVETGPSVMLEERRPSALLQINGTPPSIMAGAGLRSALGLEADPQANHALAGSDVTLLWTGADQWLAVSSEQSVETLGNAVRTGLGGADSTFTDLSHARTVVRVGGAMARDLIAKGCPLDVDALVPGDSASSMLGSFNVIIHCRAEDSFDLYVFRSFGLAMWEWLCEEALEFGVRVLGKP